MADEPREYSWPKPYRITSDLIPGSTDRTTQAATYADIAEIQSTLQQAVESGGQIGQNDIQAGLRYSIADGSLVSPGLAFQADPDCGLRRVADNRIALVAGSVDAIDITSTEITLVSARVVDLTPGYPIWGATAGALESGRPATSITVADSPYSVAAADSLILADASGGDIDIMLPAASGSTRREIAVRRTDTSENAVRISPDGADLINARGRLDLHSSDSATTIYCDGATWHILHYMG